MKKTQESGRSMVEMLGVLAIIGVLSVGGIAGYTMAMNRYRANEVVDMANKYAVIAYSSYMTSKMMNNGTVQANAVPTFASTGLFGSNSKVNGTQIGTATVTEDNVQITLTFDNVKICQATATSLGISNSGCSGNGGTLTADFKQS
ncbi:MAG: hypothetical protein IJC11_04275 [Alphaproteobacteria bacterium]|nr:hypothetical protein [Alphaproteobacteria bacterium]MBQ3117520.1 hypothetical protein [Alphaproteobacteria bacterium]